MRLSPMNGFYDVSQAGIILGGLTRQRVHQLVQENSLATVRRGRKIWLLTKEVDALAADRRAKKIRKGA